MLIFAELVIVLRYHLLDFMYFGVFSLFNTLYAIVTLLSLKIKLDDVQNAITGFARM